MKHLARIVFGGITLICAALVLTAIFYFQEELGLEPCPMCILSRYTFILVGAVSLVAAIHGPRGWGLKVYAVIVALLSATGLGISLRHSYLQHFPPKMETCGSDLGFLVGNFPLTQALPKIFAGTGSCSSIDWRFVGLTIPEWTLVWFVIFIAVAAWAIVATRRAPK